ncbi:unnamed protein product [Boreogadus saida]
MKESSDENWGALAEAVCQPDTLSPGSASCSTRLIKRAAGGGGGRARRGGAGAGAAFGGSSPCRGRLPAGPSSRTCPSGRPACAAPNAPKREGLLAALSFKFGRSGKSNSAAGGRAPKTTNVGVGADGAAAGESAPTRHGGTTTLPSPAANLRSNGRRRQGSVTAKRAGGTAEATAGCAWGDHGQPRRARSPC